MQGFPRTLVGKWRLFRVALCGAIAGWVAGVLMLFALIRYAGLEADRGWEIPELILFMGAGLAVFPLLYYPWGLRRVEADQEQSCAERGAAPDPPRD
jgi:hypothetical protein